jgi:hypothetical protein
MCRIIENFDDGPFVRYEEITEYKCNRNIKLEGFVNHHIECWEEDKWIRFPINVSVEIDAGCIFRLVKPHFNNIREPSRVTVLTRKQILNNKVV